ncbi:restriction endonuclease subunit S [Flavobacterium columnare]|uniref:restriction endonuclease subunit S n=1 Tax=Flavobacterium columnare TaxID=996 RepID=UPI004034D0B3
MVGTKFKNTDIGQIPEDWKTKEMREITSHLTNGFVGVAKIHYSENDNSVLYIQGYNVQENSFNFNGIKKISFEFHKKHLRSSLKYKDLLTVQTGDVGLTTYVTKDLEGSNCHALIISRYIKHLAESKYISYYLNSSFGRKRLKEIETGTTMKHINVGDFQFFKIPLPPLPEQKSIAEVLSDTDACIEGLEKLIAKKRLVKQGAMQQLLTPKEDWELKTLGEVCEIIKGQMITSKTKKTGDIPVIAGGKKPSYYHNQANRFGKTITISASGANAGFVGFYNKPIFASDCSTISESELYDIKFIYYFLTSNQEKIFKMQTGGAQPHIHPKDIKPLLFSFPKSIKEQTSIATILSDMDTEIEHLEKKLNKAKQLKQGIMQQLLTGKIRLIAED